MVHRTFGKKKKMPVGLWYSHTELSFEVQETRRIKRSSLSPRDQGSFKHEIAMRKKNLNIKLLANCMRTLEKNNKQNQQQQQAKNRRKKIGQHYATDKNERMKAKKN